MNPRTYLSIGDVLTLLRQEFPDVTISKIRFLESQGLVNPERSPSGYRKFYEQDVERLRWVLRQQREHFLPLKVIRDRLAAAGPGAPGEEADLAGMAPAVASVPATPVAQTAPASSAETADEAVPAAVGARTPEAAQVSERLPASGPALATTAAPVAGAGKAAAVAAGRVPVGEAGREARTVHTAGSSPGNGAWAPGVVLAEPEPGAGGAPEEDNGVASAAPVPPPPSGHPTEPEGSYGAGGQATSDPPPTGVDTPANETSSRLRGAPVAQQGQAHRSRGAEAAVDPSAGAGLTVEELCAASGLDAQMVASLEGFGLLQPVVVAGVTYFDEESLNVAHLVADFGRYGVQPRHLRLYRNAVDREMGLVEQLVTPLLRQRNPQSRQRAVELADEVARLGEGLRASLLRRQLRRELGG